MTPKFAIHHHDVPPRAEAIRMIRSRFPRALVIPGWDGSILLLDCLEPMPPEGPGGTVSSGPAAAWGLFAAILKAGGLLP